MGHRSHLGDCNNGKSRAAVITGYKTTHFHRLLKSSCARNIPCLKLGMLLVHPSQTFLRTVLLRSLCARSFPCQRLRLHLIARLKMYPFACDLKSTKQSDNTIQDNQSGFLESILNMVCDDVVAATLNFARFQVTATM